MPSKQKSYRSKLFNYPGALSSFSGKIELPFAFRIINKRVYDSLNTLRVLRNEAAHSFESYSLQNFKEKLELVYDFEDGFKEVVHTLAYENLIKFKKEVAKIEFIKRRFSIDDFDDIWDRNIQKPEQNLAIQEQLTIWKLAYGLTFLCLKLEAITDSYNSLTLNEGTWLSLRN